MITYQETLIVYSCNSHSTLGYLDVDSRGEVMQIFMDIIQLASDVLS